MLDIGWRAIFFYTVKFSIFWFFSFIFLPLASGHVLPCSSKNQKEILTKLNTAESPYKYDSTELNRWFSSSKPYKGASLLLHGLNNRPSTMNHLALHLSTLGYIALRGSLRGHRGSLEESQEVTMTKWREDVDQLYCLASLKSRQFKVPFIINCYSLGCLLFLDLFKRIRNSGQQNMVDKAIFISPALKVKPELSWLSHVIKILPSNWMIPSSNIRTYRSLYGTSISSYKAFFELLEKSHRNHFAKPKSIGFPQTLTLLNPKDELVDAKSIIQLFRKMPKKQSQWKLIEVENRNATTIKHINHLLLDEESLGKIKWLEWKKQISLFLKQGKPTTLY